MAISCQEHGSSFKVFFESQFTPILVHTEGHADSQSSSTVNMNDTYYKNLNVNSYSSQSINIIENFATQRISSFVNTAFISGLVE